MTDEEKLRQQRMDNFTHLKSKCDELFIFLDKLEDLYERWIVKYRPKLSERLVTLAQDTFFARFIIDESVVELESVTAVRLSYGQLGKLHGKILGQAENLILITRVRMYEIAVEVFDDELIRRLTEMHLQSKTLFKELYNAIYACYFDTEPTPSKKSATRTKKSKSV